MLFSGSRPFSRFACAALCVVLCALMLRLLAARGPLWLDEIWSLDLAAQMHAWRDVFRLKHDNHHLLNTAWLYALGEGHAPLFYRLPTVLAGTCSVVAAGWLMREQPRPVQWFALYGVATSYLLVHYSSEARGYGLGLLASLVACRALLVLRHGAGYRAAVLCAAALGVACLSHLSFVWMLPIAALFVLLDPSERGVAVKLRYVCACCGAPALLVSCYVWLIRGATLGGGPPYQLLDVLACTASLVVGGPAQGPGMYAVAAVLPVALVAMLLSRAPATRDVRQLAMLMIVVPLLAVAVAPPPFLFVRYFLLPVLGATLLLALAAGRIWHTTGAARCAVLLVLVMWTAGHGVHYYRLAAVGRDNFSQVVSLLVAHSSSAETVEFSSDHDHAAMLLTRFYADSARLKYCSANNEQARPEWLLLHEDPLAPRDLADQYTWRGAQYCREAIADSAALSGFRWHCYRRQPQVDTAP